MSTKKLHLKNMITMYSGLPKEVYVLFFGKLLTSMGAFIYPLLTLILTNKIGLSVHDTSVFITILCICQMGATLIGGKLVDTIGRKKVMIIFPTISAFCYIACGLLPLSKLVALLILLGSFFFCISNSSYDSMIADVTDESNRRNSYSLIYMGLNLGYSIGPLLGGFLFNKYLSLVFIGDGLTTLVSCAMILFTIKESYDVKNEEPIEEEPSLEQAEEGSLFKVLLSRPSLICYFLSVALMSFTYNQISFSLPVRLQELFAENSSILYGSLMTVNGIVVMVFTPFITYISRKVSIITSIVIGSLLYVLGFSMIGIFNGTIFFYIAFVLISFGEIAVSTNSGTLINNITPSSHRGRVNSLEPISDRIGTILGTYTMGFAITSFGSAFPFYFVGILSIISAILVYSINFIKNYDKVTAIE